MGSLWSIPGIYRCRFLWADGGMISSRDVSDGEWNRVSHAICLQISWFLHQGFLTPWDERCGIVAMAVRTLSVISNSGHISVSFSQKIIGVPRSQPLEIPSVPLKACEIPPKLGSKYPLFIDLPRNKRKARKTFHGIWQAQGFNSLGKKK